MTSLYRSIIFYLIGLCAFFCIAIFYKEDITGLIIQLKVWLNPAIISFLGFISGKWIYQYFFAPAKGKGVVLTISHSIFLLFFLSSTFFSYRKSFMEQQNVNSSHNHSVMKSFVVEEEYYIRTAFKKLEAEFSNPNDFSLNSFSVRTIDTIYNDNYNGSIYNVYFTYNLNGSNELYFSKVRVFANIATIVIFNENTSTNEEYLSIRLEKLRDELETLESINKLIEELPDSQSREIINILKETFQQ